MCASDVHMLTIGAWVCKSQVRHFFWYLMTLDLTGWSAEPVPETPLMQQLALEADPIASWFRAFTADELFAVLPYTMGRHYTSNQLMECFRAWANDHEVVVDWTEREFFLRLSRFAKGNEHLLVPSNHGAAGKGYIMKAPRRTA